MHHPAQVAWHQTTARFNVVPAGRRSYKTERAKRKLVFGTPMGEARWPGALTLPEGRFFASAPTHKQAKAIFWKDRDIVYLGCKRLTGVVQFNGVDEAVGTGSAGEARAGIAH